MTGKWLKWKLIHKETGLSFNQYYRKNFINTPSGSYNYKDCKLIPVLLQSGITAFYVDQPYYPYMSFLINKEWTVEQK